MSLNFSNPQFPNPFRPGAGHTPPYLAGRDQECEEFRARLRQTVITENLILTGLRGVGKTVLLDSFRPIALSARWGWVGTDLSESASLSEERLAIRLITDLSVFTSSIVMGKRAIQQPGFSGQSSLVDETLHYGMLEYVFRNTPGLISDKLKRVLEFVWESMDKSNIHGLVFAYDEAQTLADHTQQNEFPLSVLLDVFQSIQRKGVRFLLLLTGLPTLYSKLVEARTYTERMFHVLTLSRLNDLATRSAIVRPIEQTNCPVKFNETSVQAIAQISGGYPYFIQFVCREVFDLFIQQSAVGQTLSVPTIEIVKKLDTDFFSGRWSRVTERQREFLSVIASLSSSDDPDFEFSGSEVSAQSKNGKSKPFSSSHTNQLLSSLSDVGLVYKNRHGRYSFAVPLLGRFIQRQLGTQQPLV
jgi:hypothetical protein